MFAAGPVSPSHQSISFYDNLIVNLPERCASMMGSYAADFLATSSCSCLLKATREVLAVDADHRIDGLHTISSLLALVASVSTTSTAVLIFAAEQADLCAIVPTNLLTVKGGEQILSSLSWSA